MGLSPAFSQLLSDRREQFNARVAAARVRNPSFDLAAFTAFLEGQGDPLLAKALAEKEGNGAALIDAIFDAAIVLTEQRWVGTGARAQTVNRLWSDVMPQFARAVGGQPKATIAALINATIKVSQEPGLDIEQWLSWLGSYATKTRTVDEARHLIVICTWRSGSAHMRDAALAAASKLSPEVACAVIGAGCETDWQTISGHFATHHWWAPGAKGVSDGHRVGAFIGFGGALPEPPTLHVANDMFIARSGGQEFVVFADAYGATLRPVHGADDVDELKQSQSDGGRLKGQSVRADDRLVPLLIPAAGVSIVETTDSIAVSSSYSHSIQVLPKVLP